MPTAPTAPTAVPDFPELSDRTTYNARAFAWAEHMDNVYPAEMLALAENAYDNAVEANADAVATAADRVQTGLDVVATAADRVATGLDVVATAADAANVMLMDKRYLGAFASNPTLDNQGAALQTGAVCYNTTLAKVLTWSGSAWVEGIASVTGVASVNGATGAVTVQPTLVSGTSIKTINSTSLLGAGDIAISTAINTETRTANTALGVADKGKLIDLNAAFTQTFVAAATLGAGWYVYLRVIGTGDVTLDPNASELIDGVVSGLIKPGMSVLIVCDGTGFKAMRLGPPTVLEVKTSGTSWTCPIGVRSAEVTAIGGGGGFPATGGGGGGGNCIRTYITSPATTYTYAIGAGGSSNTDGGNTTFTDGTTSMTASGGAYLGDGGAASGGQINIPGAVADTVSPYMGGDSLLGFGGNANFGLGPTGYGAGGCRNAGSFAGKAGVIVIKY